jgi:hypothetical protein
MEQLYDLLARGQFALSDEVLNKIDEVVPPGIDFRLVDDASYFHPPAIKQAHLRRRPATKGAAV